MFAIDKLRAMVKFFNNNGEGNNHYFEDISELEKVYDFFQTSGYDVLPDQVPQQVLDEVLSDCNVRATNLLHIHANKMGW